MPRGLTLVSVELTEGKSIRGGRTVTVGGRILSDSSRFRASLGFLLLISAVPPLLIFSGCAGLVSSGAKQINFDRDP